MRGNGVARFDDAFSQLRCAPGRGLNPRAVGRVIRKPLTPVDGFWDSLREMKIVRADYVMVLQFDPQRDDWLVHNFEQATMELTF